MIIGLAARMGSGKSLIADVLVNTYNFEKISFATCLKKIISELFNDDINNYYNLYSKNKIFDEPWIIDRSKLEEITQLTFDKLLINKKIYSRRDALQYVGTLLRSVDKNFHINKTLSSLDISKDYVFDDVRYLNELDALKNMGAYNFFIIKPNNLDISNHESETSLFWKDFRHIIVNNSSIDALKKSIKLFIEIIKITPKYKYEKILSIFENGNYDSIKIASQLGCRKIDVLRLSKQFIVFIPNNFYHFNKNAFLSVTPEAAYYAGVLSASGHFIDENMAIEVEVNNYSLLEGLKNFLNAHKFILPEKRSIRKLIYKFVINDPLVIENIKYWNVKEHNSSVPDIIKGNNELLEYWISGLIAGNSYILYRKGKEVSINIVAAEAIIDFIIFKYKYLNPRKYMENRKRKLFKAKFIGSNAALLYSSLNINILHEKRWEKFEKYIQIQNGEI